MSDTVFGGPDRVQKRKDVPDWDNQGPLLKQKIIDGIGEVMGLSNIDPSFKSIIEGGIDSVVMYCEMARDSKRFANDPLGTMMDSLKKSSLRTLR